MTEAELIAAAAMVMVGCVEALGENQSRAHRGEHPAFREHCGVGAPWTEMIETEMKRRQEIKKEK